MQNCFTKKPSICCKNGNATVTQVAAPEELRQLFSDTTIEGRHFRQNIRGYNHVMSFTSLGVHIDETMHATSRGIYTFRAQGSIYHKIGGFHPNQGSRPRFLQLYIYDTDNELQNRMIENPQLNQDVVRRLQNMLYQYNPFVHNLRQLALQPNVHECRLLIKERPSNQPQYNLPSASEVAAIIVGGDDVTLERGRDINIFSNDGNLQKIRANDRSILLKSGRLLQQYVVDNYVKIETGRLRKLGLAPKDPEQKIKVTETGHVRLSDHLVRLSKQVTVAIHFVRFLVTDWSLTSSLKRTSSSSNQKSSLTCSLTVRLGELNPEKL
ncbi:hypothetical protein MTR_0077s0060 [Medicago truncatula]|uniref:Helitron helicase-like domain-containing protein n=1 Tax=Medicago truncatula TaxID=3880 RepID=A0A072TI54_MEDTR|nr:hypothetical protein MTR_0077s0060 [Medicago truncatula]